MTVTHTNMEVTSIRYCITCEQLIRAGLITCVDCEKILDIIAGSPIPSFQNSNTEPSRMLSQDLCCMCASPTMLGSQFCSECECSMAMVLEDPAYAFDVELPSPQRQTNAREVTQDVQPANEEDSDEEIEVVAALTETELMMQRFEEAKQSGDVVELLDDDDDAEAEPSPSKMAELANHTTSACQNDDDIQFIRTTCSAVF